MPDLEEIGRALFGHHFRKAFINWFCINERALRRGMLRQRDFSPQFWSDVIAALELCAKCGPANREVTTEMGSRAERNERLAVLRDECVIWRDHRIAQDRAMWRRKQEAAGRDDGAPEI